MGGYNVLYLYLIIVCLTDIEIQFIYNYIQLHTMLFIDNIISSFVY